MINAEVMREAEQRRLAWRCRRGMLELDIVLQRFVANCFGSLTLDEMERFDALLELPDNAFWSMIQGEQNPSDTVMQSVIQKLYLSSQQTMQEAT